MENSGPDSKLTCLGANPGGLEVVPCADAHYAEQWNVFEFLGSYKFQNQYTRMCLDGSSTYGVRQHTCSDASYNNGYQKWVVFTSNADGSFVDWKNVATGLCLDYSSTYRLRLHTCSRASYDNGYQAWENQG